MAPYSNVECDFGFYYKQRLSWDFSLTEIPRFQWELYNYRQMTGALPQIGVKTAHLHADGRLPSARLKCPLDGELRVQGYELRWSLDFCWCCSAGAPGNSGGAVVPLQSLCLLLSHWSLQFYPSSFWTIELVFRVNSWLPLLSLFVTEFSSNISEYLHVTADKIYIVGWLTTWLLEKPKIQNAFTLYPVSNRNMVQWVPLTLVPNILMVFRSIATELELIYWLKRETGKHLPQCLYCDALLSADNVVRKRKEVHYWLQWWRKRGSKRCFLYYY